MATRKRRWVWLVAVYLVALAVLCGCQSFGKGPISEPIVGVGAALLAALDQLLASGMLTPEQHAILHAGIRDIAVGTAQAAQGIQDLTKRVEAVDSNSVGPGTITAVGGGIAAVGAAWERWRNGPAATPDERAERIKKHAEAAAAKAKRRSAA